MQTAEIRQRFLDYFEAHGHAALPSTPLVHEDPNLLFVNAGMVPMVPYFLGQQSPPAPRAVTAQKCVRTNDIEEVGATTRHGTFFQMLGNFSFGDYFKAEAIQFAWELFTGSPDQGGLGFDLERLWVSVLAPGVHPDYPDGDQEAFSHWRSLGMPAERIQYRALKENYWHMGIPGPGGPDSEMFFDRGPEFGPDGGPEADEDRFIEIGNLVFQTEMLGEVRSKDDFDVLGKLESRNIDTGFGLERIAYLLQGKNNIYEIDQIFPVIARACELAGRTYGADAGADVRLRVVGDHVRSSLMLIGDGVTPGNEGRGYVLRRLMRRAIRSMRLLGVQDPVLPHLLPVSKDQMASSYPQLERDFRRISDVAYAEEEAFRRTLTAGTTILDTAVTKAKAADKVLSGADAFALHDTYGFPIDLTLEMAQEQGVSVDEDGFRRLMAEQRSRAKADAKAKKQGHGGTTAYRAISDRLGRGVEFTGYEGVSGEGRVAGIVRDGEEVQRATEGDEIELVLDTTPFYAESGGQLADRGRIQLAGGAILDVKDVQKPIAGIIVHRGTLLAGEVVAGEGAQAEVDAHRRSAISRAHTATHIVHKALREALGEGATQAGSENAPGRMRFDFRSPRAVEPGTLAAIERRVNERLMDDLPVSWELMSQAEAREAGAMALFGEKYGDVVRVVSVGGPWSLELCGGTHAGSSAQLGLVKLLGEASIGAGVRRVEALVGRDAYDFLSREHVIVNQLTDTLKARPEELSDRVGALMTRLKDAERELAKHRQSSLMGLVGTLVESATDAGGVRLVTSELSEGTTGDEVRQLVLETRTRLGDASPVVVAAAAATNGRPVVVIATNQGARDAGLAAGALVKTATAVLGGGGGGKPDLAQGGGADATKLREALDAIGRAVRDARG